jgi:predicted nucleic-acid-binding Zn-ribbon protein
MNPKLLKFKKVNQKSCECCGYLGDLGFISTELVSTRNWQLILILIAFCFAVIPGFIALLIWFGTRKMYDIMWCPQCGNFSFYDTKTDTSEKMVSFCLKDIDSTLLDSKDKRIYKKVIEKATKKYNL